MQKAIDQSDEMLAGITAGPFITIIEPFEPRMNAADDLRHRVKCAADQAGKELAEKYPLKAGELTDKLRRLLNAVDYSRQKSILLLVGSQVEKAIYLDEAVSEKIQVGDLFDPGDLYLKQQHANPFLLLVLSAGSSKIFVGNDQVKHLEPVLHTSGDEVKTDLSERVSNFSDPNDRKESNTKKYFREIDHSLTELLKSHPYPVILACTSKCKGYFMDLTSNSEQISDYIEGNYDDFTSAQLMELIRPSLERLQKNQEKTLVKQLEEAIDRHEAAVGIQDVLKAAREGRGRLLLVERDYKDLGGGRDLVPLIISLVISYGGEVRFVNQGMLREHTGVAMLLSY